MGKWLQQAYHKRKFPKIKSFSTSVVSNQINYNLKNLKYLFFHFFFFAMPMACKFPGSGIDHSPCP